MTMKHRTRLLAGVLSALLLFTSMPAAALAGETETFVPTKKAKDGTLVGDVNKDDAVDATDRMILARYLAGWEGYGDRIKSMDAADIDRDGDVNAKDRMLLARFLAGWSGYDEWFASVDDMVASGKCGDNLKWSLNEDGALTISGTGDMWDFGDENPSPWSAYKSQISTIVFEEGITSIGDSAFSASFEDPYGFTGSLVFPQSLEEIGWAAFYGAKGFTGVLNIPEKVWYIHGLAFCDCIGFSGTLSLPDNLTNLELWAFHNCTGFTGLKLPAKLTVINEAVFRGCSGLTGQLIIPETVKEIQLGAFDGCCGLTGDLILPEKLIKLGESSFKNCSGLSGILDLPIRVSEIPAWCFAGCSGLEGVVLHGSRILLLCKNQVCRRGVIKDYCLRRLDVWGLC